MDAEEVGPICALANRHSQAEKPLSLTLLRLLPSGLDTPTRQTQLVCSSLPDGAPSGGA